MNTQAIHQVISRVTRGCNTVIQGTFYSVLLSHATFLPYAHATPVGGEIAQYLGSAIFGVNIWGQNIWGQCKNSFNVW